MKIPQSRQVVANHRLPLILRQEGQDRQAALADAQRHATADITGKGADRKRPFAAVQADRIETAARQQEQRVTEGGRQTQQCRTHQFAQIAALPGPGRQGEELQAQAITLAAPVLLDHPFLHQAAQQAVGGWLGQADVLRQLGHPLAVFRCLPQAAQYREQPGHRTDTDFIFIFIPISGIHQRISNV